MLFAASVSADARTAAPAGSVCEVPGLKELTLSVVRERIAHAGCRLQLKGAKLELAAVQTIERQSPAAGGRAAEVTVWLNPFCHGSAAYGPELNEPAVTPGPTEFVAGFYLVGGPLAQFSTPGCRRREPPPEAGVVEVFDATTGALVASQTSTAGHFVEIPLQPGSYKLVGTFVDPGNSPTPPTTIRSVEIPPGHTVRQDFFLSVP